MTEISALVRKLESIARLTKQDRAALAKLPMRTAVLEPGDVAVADGEVPSQCCLLNSGMMSRYKFLSKGGRQILAFHTSGDIPDLHSLHIDVMDHNLAAVSRCTVAFIRHEHMHRLLEEAPHLHAVFWRETLIDAAIFRAWITAMGRLNSVEHLAHLLCELYTRKYAIGEAKNSSCEVPLTQIDLADALGISTVHVNRSMQHLRAKHLVEFERGRLTIFDWHGLKEVCEFDPCYLQIHEDKLPKEQALIERRGVGPT